MAEKNVSNECLIEQIEGQKMKRMRGRLEVVSDVINGINTGYIQNSPVVRICIFFSVTLFKK